MNQRRSSGSDRYQSNQQNQQSQRGGGRYSQQGGRGYGGGSGGSYEGMDFENRRYGGSSQGQQDYENYDRSRSRSPSYRGGETGRGIEDARYGRFNEEETHLGRASRGGYQGGPQGGYQGGYQGGDSGYRDERGYRGEPYYGGGGGRSSSYSGDFEQDQSARSPGRRSEGRGGQRGMNYEREAERNNMNSRRSGSFRNSEDDYYRDDDMDSRGRY